MQVLLAARRDGLLREIASRIAADGGRAVVCAADLRRTNDIERLVGRALDAFGHIEVLVANAGMGCHEAVAETSDAEMAAVVEVNLLGVMHCARMVLPHMLRRGRGHIIVVSSVTTGIAWPNDAIYAATKAGVSRFARGLRNELAPRGIRVTDVVPGVIDTPLSREASVLPRAGATRVADAIVGAIRRPRNVVVTPSWYRLLLLVNRALPGVVDSVLRRTSAE